MIFIIPPENHQIGCEPALFFRIYYPDRKEALYAKETFSSLDKGTAQLNFNLQKKLPFAIDPCGPIIEDPSISQDAGIIDSAIICLKEHNHSKEQDKLVHSKISERWNKTKRLIIHLKTNIDILNNSAYVGVIPSIADVCKFCFPNIDPKISTFTVCKDNKSSDCSEALQ